MTQLSPKTLLLLALAAFPVIALAAPPTNDTFANRLTISGSLPTSVSGTTVEATKQSGEPNHGGYSGGRSVWWTWTAPSTGECTLRFSNYSYPFYPLLGVYTGTSVNALTLVGSSSFGDPLTLNVTAGTVYQIAVDSYDSNTGTFTLNLIPPPVNNSFSNRLTITGSLPTSVSGTTVEATKQSGEPNHGGYSGGRSVWWTWTAPTTGICTVSFSGYSYPFYPLLGVYTGTSVNALTTIGSASFGSSATIDVTAGSTYQIAVDSYDGNTGPFTLNLSSITPPPANDHFANRITLPSGAVNVSGTNVAATKEAGEPNDFGGSPGGRSVWWSWTAPSTGECVVKVTASFSRLFGVYTGSSVNALTAVMTSSGNTKSFNAVSGTTYHIAVDGYSSSSGSFTLELSAVYPAPANDSFANRTALTSGATTFAASNFGSSKEAGEPNHGSYTGGRSTWWTWTAPLSGEVAIQPSGNTFNSLISVYTGTAVGSLTHRTSSTFGGRATFSAVSGTAYQIALDGVDGASGTVSISLSNPVPPPANDNFASRAALTGAFVKAASSNVGATSEVGEPFHAGLGGGKSVWYTWTAPSTGTFTAYLTGSSTFLNRLLNFYTGSSVGALTSVASGSGGYSSPLQVSLSATAGTVYQIAIDGGNPGSGAYSGTFVFTLSQPPANENFANAVNLGSAASGSSSSWIDFSSTTETNEPGAPRFPWLPGPRTVWWKWTAPASGFFTFDVLGADFDTVLEIYTGTSVNALTPVVGNHDADAQGRSRVALKATLGTTYHIRVSGETPNDVGYIPLQFSQLSAPANAADYVTLGRAHLQQQTDADLNSANTAFNNALALDANHAEANFLKAITTFAQLEQGTAFQNTLTALGMSDSSLYSASYGMPKDAMKNRIIRPGTSTTAVGINYLADTVLPALTVIRGHLAKASSPSFTTLLTDSETADRLMLMDAADVSLIHACTYAIEAITRLLQTYNAGADVAAVITAANNDTLTIENVASSFTNLLTFTGNDQRTAFKTALQSANTHYQACSTFVRTTRADKRDPRHLFFLRSAGGDIIEEEVREHLQATSNSLNGATTVGGETVNLAQLITSPKSLREQLIGLVGNKGVVSTTPDPTFGGILPNATQAKVNGFLRRTGFLHEITNFSTWAAAFLGGQSVPNQAKTADPDKDMLSNFAEYAFNLNPGKSSGTQEYAVNSLQTNVSDGKKYLNFSFVRRIDRATIDYVVAVSDNLTAWDRTGTQVQQVGAAAANADGVTETVTVRLLADPLVTSRKFVRLEVGDLNP